MWLGSSALAASMIAASIWVTFTAPIFLSGTVLVWVFGAVVWALVVLFLPRGEPIAMSIEATSVTFTRRNGRPLSYDLTRKRRGAILLDRSANPGVTSGFMGSHSPYHVIFLPEGTGVALTRDALDALQAALPSAGLVLVESGPFPLQRRTLRRIYRKPKSIR